MTVTHPGPTQDRRKRLGQYFTGVPLARLLAALASAQDAQTIIDPMAGSGDMLVAAHSLAAPHADLTAVEIDPEAAAKCCERLASVDPHGPSMRVGNAFDPSTWFGFEEKTWDLVITNPPYVRYQLASSKAEGPIAVPSAQEVRSGLAAILTSRSGVPRSERDLFQVLAEHHSGLADLAVPSWILCASLVRRGGRLAMVVPDTWLSRDYALPVQYLLHRLFEVESVIEDGEAQWFPEVLVRTTLVVARRVPDRGPGQLDSIRKHIHIRLCSKSSMGSIVGNMYPYSEQPDVEFASDVAALAASPSTPVLKEKLRTRWVAPLDASSLGTRPGDSKWLQDCEPGLVPRRPNAVGRAPALPTAVRDIVGDLSQTWNLESMGWNVGQGLRTGANRFFYGDLVDERPDEILVRVDPEISPRPIPVPLDAVATVVRKQSDLVGGKRPEDSLGRLLLLNCYALPEDLDLAAPLFGPPTYHAMTEPLAEHVRRASTLNVGTDENLKTIPELSAVRTNIRTMDPKRPLRPPRFWYQLPPLAPRHTPQLLISRVNHGHPIAMRNPTGTIIDANFSTLWPAKEHSLPGNALLALLHSTWAIAVLESTGTVLGGGALKIEATHLRKLAFPPLNSEQITALTGIGEQLIHAAAPQEQARASVDNILTRALARRGLGRSNMHRLDQLAAELRGRRTRQLGNGRAE
ncbi:N-6 DNA methylase [Candidatus Poriferisocius sp.]|uniref:N-6 DNA methylase n=1 Tax=Candidatus Poriferisocius sp. TaxID=3101276 RepID=UPI003B027E8D